MHASFCIHPDADIARQGLGVGVGAEVLGKCLSEVPACLWYRDKRKSVWVEKKGGRTFCIKLCIIGKMLPADFSFHAQLIFY